MGLNHGILGVIGSDRFNRSKRRLSKRTRKAYLDLYLKILKKIEDGEIPKTKELKFIIEFWVHISILEQYSKV